MPTIYSYQIVSDQHTTYYLLLPETAEDVPGCIDLGEKSGLHYVLLPDGAELPPQPAQVQATLQTVVPTQGLITSLIASSPLLALMKRRINKDEPTPRYSLRDERTLGQCYDWMPPGLVKNVEEGRAWAK